MPVTRKRKLACMLHPDGAASPSEPEQSPGMPSEGRADSEEEVCAAAKKGRWQHIPALPLNRVFELIFAQPEGLHTLRVAQLVSKTWRASVQDVVLRDTASSRPERPPMPACSSDWGGSVTLNTCGGMVLGTQRSEELSNNGPEVCSKPSRGEVTSAARRVSRNQRLPNGRRPRANIEIRRGRGLGRSGNQGPHHHAHAAGGAGAHPMAHPPVAAAAHAAALAAAIAQAGAVVAQAGAVVAQAGAAQGATGLALPPSTSHGSGAELQAAPVPGDDTRSESAAGPCPNDRRRSSRMPTGDRRVTRAAAAAAAAAAAGGALAAAAAEESDPSGGHVTSVEADSRPTVLLPQLRAAPQAAAGAEGSGARGRRRLRVRPLQQAVRSMPQQQQRATQAQRSAPEPPVTRSRSRQAAAVAVGPGQAALGSVATAGQAVSTDVAGPSGWQGQQQATAAPLNKESDADSREFGPAVRQGQVAASSDDRQDEGSGDDAAPSNAFGLRSVLRYPLIKRLTGAT